MSGIELGVELGIAITRPGARRPAQLRRGVDAGDRDLVEVHAGRDLLGPAGRGSARLMGDRSPNASDRSSETAAAPAATSCPRPRPRGRRRPPPRPIAVRWVW